MDYLQPLTTLAGNSNVIITTTGTNWLSISSSGGGGGGGRLKDNNTIKMRETKQTIFEISFLKTKVEKVDYKVLAESYEDAKKRIEEGHPNYTSEVVSLEVVEVK